jgi:membrane fusion protein (multidrug efflux system)
VDARVDAGTRSISLRANLTDSDGLLPGMFTRITINLGQPVTVVTVPETAVSYSLHGNTVYVIDTGENGLQVQPRVVATGDTRGGKIAITQGLQSGEQVVTVGQNKLHRGAQVVIDETVQLP